MRCATMKNPRTSRGIRLLAGFAALIIIAGLLAVGWRIWRQRTPKSADPRTAPVVAAAVENHPPSQTNAGGAGTAQGERASVKHDEHGKKLANLDTRAGGGDPGEKRARALAALRAKVPGVEVRFDPVTGAPDHIMATGRFLSQGKSQPDDAYAAVRDFVNEHADLFGHDATLLDDSRVTREDVTAHNGMRTVVWQQQVDGVPVYNTILKANLTKEGALVTMGSHFMSDATAATGMDAATRTALVAQPPVDVKKAVSLAAAHLGDAVAPEQARETTQPQGAERMQRFSAPGLSDTNAGLAWLPMDAASLKLTWDVTLMSLAKNEMFRVLVDAQTGEVLMRTSLTDDISNASYRVFVKPDLQPMDSPSPFSPALSTPGTFQPAVAPRNLITLQAFDTTASPNGWINDGDTDMQGNNVDAHTDLTGANTIDLPRPTSATRTFDFAIDFAQAPSTFKDAAVTQLFYYTNYIHDRLYELGFTESAGNFQTNNFGRGGLGNDRLQADAQDGSGTNNANFSTPADGSSPRMQMFLWTGPTPARDGDFDGEVVLHEYTHGLSNRLVGGGVGISANQTRGMGEGWSDFYGIALLAEPADDLSASWARGGYSRYLLSGTFNQNYYFGGRRYPYSTDLTKNPLTFKDIDTVLASAHPGIPVSPVVGSTPSEVHNEGEVWCVTLWDARANLINKFGYAIGSELILQLVTDGMKLAPANPNFLQGRDAIIQADLVNSGGANRNALWAAFAKRGMGASATSPASTLNTGIVEAYDISDNLGVTPIAAWLAQGNSGGPFSPGSQAYTLANSAATAQNWTAAKTQSWLTLSSAGGTLGAGANTTVTATINSTANALADGTYTDTITFTNITTGVVQTRTVTLRIGQKDYFTELFTSGNDTSNQSFLFTPNGSASYYSVQRTPGTTFYTDPTRGHFAHDERRHVRAGHADGRGAGEALRDELLDILCRQQRLRHPHGGGLELHGIAIVAFQPAADLGAVR